MAKRTKPEKQRAIMCIEITPEARDRLVAISHDIGLRHIVIVSRAIEWFAACDTETQAAVLGWHPDLLKKDAVTMLLEKMAK